MFTPTHWPSLTEYKRQFETSAFNACKTVDFIQSAAPNGKAHFESNTKTNRSSRSTRLCWPLLASSTNTATIELPSIMCRVMVPQRRRLPTLATSFTAQTRWTRAPRRLTTTHLRKRLVVALALGAFARFTRTKRTTRTRSRESSSSQSLMPTAQSSST